MVFVDEFVAASSATVITLAKTECWGMMELTVAGLIELDWLRFNRGKLVVTLMIAGGGRGVLVVEFIDV